MTLENASVQQRCLKRANCTTYQVSLLRGVLDVLVQVFDSDGIGSVHTVRREEVVVWRDPLTALYGGREKEYV